MLHPMSSCMCGMCVRLASLVATTAETTHFLQLGSALTLLGQQPRQLLVRARRPQDRRRHRRHRRCRIRRCWRRRWQRRWFLRCPRFGSGRLELSDSSRKLPLDALLRPESLYGILRYDCYRHSTGSMINTN